MHDEPIVAVNALLRRIADTDEPALALSADAVADALRLADTAGDDLDAAFALGWLHWYRHLALPDGGDEAEEELQLASTLLASCFLAGRGPLPVPLLPQVLDAATTVAGDLLKQAADTPDPGVATAAVDAWQRIIDATTAGEPARAGSLASLSLALFNRFNRTGALDDLEAALRAGREAVDSPHDAADAGFLHANLATILRGRFEQTGAIEDLDAAIDSFRQTVGSLAEDQPERAMWLFHLAYNWSTRVELTGAPQDLDAAIEAGRRAVEAIPEDFPDRVGLLQNLAADLRYRLDLSEDPDDLDALIEVLGQLVAALPDDDPDRAGLLFTLAMARSARFELAGDPADEEAAVQGMTQALEATDHDDAGRPDLLATLCSTALLRYVNTTRALDDLDLSINAGREAVDITPASDPSLGGTLSNFGTALRNRFERTAVSTDLDESIEASGRAVALMPVDNPGWATAVFNLGAALHIRYQHARVPADLDGAIWNLRQAVDAAPEGHSAHVMALSSLGLALRSQFERTEAPADLDAAVEAARRAVDDLPADARDGALYQANLTGILISRAAYGYNQAALLRTQGRMAEAEAGYQAVVAEFRSNAEPQIGFWVALALYNHVTLLIETAGDEVAAQRVPALVATLRVGFADSEHPWVQRRVRVAMRTEMELFERLEWDQKAAESRSRLHELLRPATELVLSLLAEDDPTGSVDAAAPRWPAPLSEQVSWLLLDVDASLDLVRELAAAEAGDLLDLVCPYPGLMSLAAMKIFTAVKDGQLSGAQDEDDRASIDRGLTALASVFQFLHDKPAAYPLGSGAIETLHAAVDVTVSMTDALEYVRSPGIVQALSIPYAQALAEAAMTMLPQGEWRRASRLQQLLLAAAERLPDYVDGRAIVAIARYRWLFVARQVLMHLPDGRVLHSATDAGERLLTSLQLDPETTPGQLAEVLLALAALYVAPYNRVGPSATPDVINLSELRRWLDRLDEEVLDPVEIPDGVDPVLPGLTEALEIGEEYLRRALEVAEPAQVGHALGMMLSTRTIRANLGEDIDRAEYADIAARGVATVDADRYPQLMAQALLAQVAAGQVADEGALDRLLAHPIAEIAERAGDEAAVGVLVGVGQVLRGRDPAAGRRLFAQAEDFIRRLGEADRMAVLTVHQGLLLDSADLTPEDPDPALHPRDAAAALLDRAKSAGWPAERTALALIALTGRGHRQADDLDREQAWLVNLAVLPELYPDVVAGHTDVLAFFTAGLHVQAAYVAHERGDWPHAVQAQAAACKEYLSLSARDAAMESLTLIALAVENAHGVGLAAAAARGLAAVVVPAENLIGASATDVLQAIWSRVIGAVADTADVPALFACMQLAKGARFVDALHAGLAFDARTDDRANDLLAAIGQLEEPADSDVELDAATLVAPYTERLDAAGGVSLAQQRENLQRTFDALVQRRLTAPQAAPPRLLSIDTVLGLLPPDTVLLWSYLAQSPEDGGGRSLVSLVASGERLAVVSNPMLGAEQAGLKEWRVGDRVRVVDALGISVAWMRQAVQDEPGPVLPVARSGEWPFADGLAAIYGPVADLLREEHEAGRNHLVIVPHGPLHFAPLHLLYLDGRPLAETFAVTYLPNLALLERLATPVAARPPAPAMSAVGIGFADGPLAAIPEAVDEAQAVAAAFGPPALTDAQATHDAVFAALASVQLFHIATHGVHNVAAPAFQCLYLADGQVSAHELLRLELTGLNLVTMSACETALGRFDAADNLRGIPAYLLLRGTAAIVGTLWPVESRTSKDFFTTLYRELRKGGSRLDAFATAQQQTRATHPQYRDWGAFYYTGDWR